MAEPDAPIRVLLVDDEVEFLVSTSRMLQRRGLKVNTCEDGYCALDLLGRQTVDVVVLDVRMPGMGGVEVFREIKRCWPGLPVVMLTGHLTNELAYDLAQEGAFQYVAKPCDVTVLLDVIQRAARREHPLLVRSNAPAQESSIRVLLVDDEAQALEARVCDLRIAGLKVVVARSPKQAGEDLDRLSFDLVVWDADGHPDAGLAMARRARERQPSAALLALMRDVDLAPWGDARWADGIARLRKPVAGDGLARAIVDTHKRQQLKLASARGQEERK